jgi:hypothetical protein
MRRARDVAATPRARSCVELVARAHIEHDARGSSMAVRTSSSVARFDASPADGSGSVEMISVSMDVGVARRASVHGRHRGRAPATRGDSSPSSEAADGNELCGRRTRRRCLRRDGSGSSALQTAPACDAAGGIVVGSSSYVSTRNAPE